MSFGYQILGFGSGGASFLGVVDDAKYYDGTNDYASRGSDLTGSADGKQGVISFWLKPDSTGTGTTEYIQGSSGSRMTIWITVDGKVTITGKNSSATTILDLTSNADAIVRGEWNHIMASWDLTLSDSKRALYVNSQSNLASYVWTNDTIDYTRPDYYMSHASGGVLKYKGCTGEVYLNHQEYLDLQLEANRLKFIGADDQPASLGADGSTPTGTAPVVYFPDGNPAVNAGTGGNFVITGALTACG